MSVRTRQRPLKVLLTTCLALCLASCAEEPFQLAALETGQAWPLEPLPTDEKLDALVSSGPSVADAVSTEVWSVRNAWHESQTPEANLAGVAWGANSGLDWEQKYDAWVASLPVMEAFSGGQTVGITTPYGKELQGPVLECAEIAMFLRALFASWYHLPFFLEGWDSEGRRPMYAGHFGFITKNGDRYKNFPVFKNAYKDHESEWATGDEWPSDASLRTLKLGDDDLVPFLGETTHMGAYFDEVVLNKRVGYFMRLLLVYFGSANLADTANTFNLKPAGLAAGDILLERWQKKGIGHTIPVMRAEQPVAGRFAPYIATGSMPRRQPVWAGPASARWYFVSQYTGGNEISADEGVAYSKLGGGLKRWRTATKRHGRWSNEVRAADQSMYISSSDAVAIGARPQEFMTILEEITPEQIIAEAIKTIEASRTYLLAHPSSCSTRTRREEAFGRLYAAMAESSDRSKADVDAEFRTLEDYVFADLEYAASKTCCWNNTTSAMGEIVLAKAEAEQAEAAASRICKSPTVFRSQADGYQQWASYAASLGRSSEWATWSEDEPCAQRNTREDVLAAAQPTPWCERPAATTVDATCEVLGPNNSIATASRIERGTINERICSGDEDWFRIPAGTGARVKVVFTHANGDIDLRMTTATGEVLLSSASLTNQESVTLPSGADAYIVVFGYEDAVNSYTLSVE